MKRIAVLTSGGDAPGMNAAIRAVTRSALGMGWEVFGVRHGFAGLMTGEFIPLQARDVGGIIQRGGTILESARSLEFKTIEGQRKAISSLEANGIDGLAVIGGNGTQTGSNALRLQGFPVVGIASTIDNDLYGSDITIGVDTALNIALEALDRLKITASSHERAFMLEVMGRDSGYLAMMTGIAGGAEAIVIPEIEMPPEDIAAAIRKAYDSGKAHAIIVIAEGARHNATVLANYFAEHHERLGFSIRVTILGHVQRGGNPSAYDRILATRLGAEAVNQIEKGNTGVLIGWVRGELATTPLDVVVSSKKKLDLGLFELARILD